MREKKNNNNFIYFSNNEKINKKNKNLSEIYAKFNKIVLYQTSKKEESKNRESGRRSFKTKNHNYYNANNTNIQFDYSDRNDNNNLNNYSLNAFDVNKNKNLNNIKLLDNEICTPRMQEKTKIFVYQKNYTHLSKTLNTFKNRENYGYHEIKDVKKNNYTQLNKKCNNTDRKNNNIKFSCYPPINKSSNNSFRQSLHMNKILNNNICTNTSYRNETKKKICTNNTTVNINRNKNILNKIECSKSKRKSSYINIKNPKDNFYNSEETIFKVKDIPSNFKDKKINYQDRNDNKNFLKNRVYNTNTPEEKRRASNNSCSSVKYNKRNVRNNNENIKEKDKNIKTTNTFSSEDLNEVINNTKIEKDLNDNKKILDKNNQKIDITKDYSPIKKENALIIEQHNKKDSINNCIEVQTEEKNYKKIESKQIIRRIGKKKFIKIPSISRLNKYDKNNGCIINEKNFKNNSKDKNKNSVIIINQYSRNEKNNNNYKEKQEKQKSKILMKNLNINNIKTTKYKNDLKEQQKTEEINNKEKKDENYKVVINKKTSFFREKELRKEKIKKICRSTEKSNNKDRNNKKLTRNSRSRGSWTKSKSKRHSNKIKNLDKLKIFKDCETNFNYDSSTNCSKDNNIDIKFRQLAIRANKSKSKKKKNINSLNLNYKSFEEDFKLKQSNIKEEKCINLKPQISCRITLTKKNNVNVVGILRYFKVNYITSENLRNKYDFDSEDTSEYYNAKF